MNKLDLLKRLFGDVLIPATVHGELLAKVTPDREALIQAAREFIRFQEDLPKPPELTAVLNDDVDPGEQQAIILA